MFIHLRTHSEFSIADGTCRIEDLIKTARSDSMPALALTDLSNMFGAIKFYSQARKKGVKPLLGADIWLSVQDSQDERLTRLLLLAQNEQGYLNLCELLSRSWAHQNNKGQAICHWQWLEEGLHEGLIALSGAHNGLVGTALLRHDTLAASAWALKLSMLFQHRFYLEIQRASHPNDEAHTRACVQLAAQLKLPVVATHPIQFIAESDFDAHEARVCIAQGEILSDVRRPKNFSHAQYFKNSAQMQALFADIPSAITNSVEIAKRCNVTLKLGKPQLPNFPIPDQTNIETYFRTVSLQGLHKRLQQLYPDDEKRKLEKTRYEQRLEFEIETILKMGFPGYFLIVSDFITWAKDNNCPVGPGRGSGAGSLVAYSLNITDLDPLAYNLLFERFLNPERVSMPDFDIDFCQSNRDRVIEYVRSKYGRDAVSQIATFGTMAARAAIRDVGRVMDLSYKFCDSISKLVPNKPGMSVTLAYPPVNKSDDDKNHYAISMEPQLARRIEQEDEVRTLIEMAQHLEGIVRNVGMHAGGVLIAPGKLTHFCPLYQQLGSQATVSQYDKDDVETAGLVKFDFLGLATLTILEHAKNLIRTRHKGQQSFTFDNIPLDDAATYHLFSMGTTESVFQFESRGMQGMLKEAKPSRLEDLIALNALYRPGPMELAPSFIARKHGREEVIYPHPLVSNILSETYGIMIYQEQVMQTAQILGGYSLGGADLLRRAMGKKKPEEMAEHRAIFRAGAAQNGINEQKADEIFDLMEKFAGYGFNKSHAAAYSLLAYQTGWLKVHYTAEFFCANMTVEMDNTDKLKVLVEDAKKNFNMTFEPPNINRSQYIFYPTSDSTICYGLGAIKGTGEQAIEAIIQARNDGGNFTSLFNFCVRVDRTKFNKRTLEALVKAGAFDCIERNRAQLLTSIDLAFDFATAQQNNINQGGLFDTPDSGGDGYGSSQQEPELITAPPFGIKEQLAKEKEALGFYLTGHLFDEVQKEIRKLVPISNAELVEKKEAQRICGIVTDLRFISGTRGRLALFKINDKSASLDVAMEEGLFNDIQSTNGTIIAEDELLILEGRVQKDKFSNQLRVNALRAWSLPMARSQLAKYLLIEIENKKPDIVRLIKEFAPKRELTEYGEIIRGLPVRACIKKQSLIDENPHLIYATYDLGESSKFFPSDAALASWFAQCDHIEIIY